MSGENMMGERKWEGVGVGGEGCTLSASDFTALPVLAETGRRQILVTESRIVMATENTKIRSFCKLKRALLFV